ncbi:hypothetical protein FKB34_01960 [Glycocaulis profundi]|nr:hypothetical protein FKB34_01960 [Glycocaulis profundi]
MKYEKSQAELELELREQIAALRASCLSYDQGNEWEAKRLATVISTLLHDSGRGQSRSLLGQTGRKDGIELSSSITREGMPARKRGWDSRCGLVVLTIESGQPAFRPKLHGEQWPQELPLPVLNFARWNSEEIFRGVYERPVTRPSLVYALRNQDGGAHVDRHLRDEGYTFWKKHGDAGIRFSDDDGVTALCLRAIHLQTGEREPIENFQRRTKPILHGPTAAMRQIAWEVDEALKAMGC